MPLYSLPLKRFPIRKFIFLFTGSFFPPSPWAGVLNGEQGLVAPALIKEMTVCPRCGISTSSPCSPQVCRNTEHFRLPWEAECHSFIFLQGIVLNVIYCSDSEFSGVFFSVAFWQMICSWTMSRLKAVLHLRMGSPQAPLGAQEEKGFLLVPVTPAQHWAGLINLPGFASLPGRKKSQWHWNSNMEKAKNSVLKHLRALPRQPGWPVGDLVQVTNPHSPCVSSL